ncbi:MULTISPECIES: hypothetical protein [unclassified Bradyrhizobium]|uniref:hypothetical protein n=1 Tax=unclassified Bradyrhizobium TaxID=2631580 RepID=UPI001BAD7A63|nr:MULTISPECIES: hypothetical protein [unclassified Bradyrhizobium]MBR1206607.1 hypothetical protein [Bradyrhizobium sp. AUGA SZCCT0124]MBR1315415.1 hypothetical protein [Bradyrhizobium sp. AUGA SZCCT0051]MBR1338523.1 hypothetical protein [Bradyrhizobium sp. AUGA SZCCT0105]MBR1356178.1 hypothetical protein [Bradyrhizobium sp. AUGA SZCCT0045]
MASSFLDVCRFTPTAGGTTDWTYSSPVTGYQSPAAAGAVNGAVYSYRAESADLSQWEVGFGAYSTGTGVLSRTTVLFNSAGTTAKINFSAAPQVAVVALAEDLLSFNAAQSLTSQQQRQARQNIGVDNGLFIADRNGVDQSGMTASAYNKISFNNKVKDANGWYDATTNFRYTPLIAGTYAIALSVVSNLSGGGEGPQAALYKNGAVAKLGTYSATGGVTNSMILAAIPMNGSTDYVEAYTYLPSTITSMLGATRFSYFQGWRIGD